MKENKIGQASLNNNVLDLQHRKYFLSATSEGYYKSRSKGYNKLLIAVAVVIVLVRRLRLRRGISPSR